VLALLATLLLHQAPSTTISDPTVQSKKVTTTTLGAKQLLDVSAGGSVIYVLDAGVLNVQGPLTDTQLRASPVPVSGTVTVGTFPDNEPFNVAQWGGSSTTLGQKAMTASVPVVLASDQSALTVATHAVTQSGTWTVQPGNTPNTTPWLTTDTPRQVASANNPGTCVSVGTSSTTVLASNGSRRAYGFKASEANTDRVYCKLGATAAATNMPFGAGSAWSQDTGAVYTGVIDCIAGSGTQTVCPFEFN
jgi:hypothetical protein